jgi:hypothetical protein
MGQSLRDLVLLHHAARSMTRSLGCWIYSKPHGAGLTGEFRVCAAGEFVKVFNDICTTTAAQKARYLCF